MSEFLSAAEAAHQALAELAKASAVHTKPALLAEAVGRITEMAHLLRATAERLRRTTGNSKILRNPGMDAHTEDLLLHLQSLLTTCMDHSRTAGKAWASARDHLLETTAECPPQFRI